jgi:cell division protein FtsI (penicillin-binding protein 3)
VRYGPAETTNENRAVTWTYEPGSINKVITAAAVLEEGLATPDAVRPVPSSLDFYGTRFGQETRSTDEDLSLRDVLAKSDNPGTINWANDLGAEKLHEYLRRFGLGSKTALDFPGESGGKVLDLADWSGTSLPTAAIGQGIAATPMQMLDVYNAIANDGVLLAPRLVLGTEDATGKFTPTPIGEPRTVVSAETAAAVRDMLTSVVQDGTGKRAQVPGYTVAGKTGTAWKAFDGDYGEPGKRKLVTSFAGFFPAADPELTILVVIDEPANPESTGGAVAAPLFSQVATYAASHLRIPPDGGGATVDPATERVRAEVELIPPATTTPGTTAPPKQG